jgi:phosphoserine phosphatase
MRQLIVFDLDKTIYNGSLGQDFILYLVSKQLISPKIISNLSITLVEYETEILSYEKTVSTVLNYLAKELEGKDFEIINKEAKNFVYINHSKFYDYAIELPKLYPQYEFLLLSLEPEFLLKHVADLIKVPNYIGNKFKHDKKIFTKDFKITTNKIELFNESKFQHMELLAAFGDSESDFEILNKAKHKFLINPSQKLLEQSKGLGFIQPEIGLVYHKFKELISN